MRFTAAVIGLGNIGLGYDFDHNMADATRILTHSAGFSNHYGFELIGAVDPQKICRDRFHEKYQLPAFESFEQLASYQKPDVVSIAVPTSHHYCVFKNAIAHQPKAILCEKPLASTVNEGIAMIEMSKANKCALMVNYIRRFDPGAIALKKALQENVIGEVYKVIMSYSKGLLTNGSHFLDLLQFLFGDVKHIKKLHQPFNQDPDIFLQINNINIYFLGLKLDEFFMQEMTIFGSSGIVRYQQGGERIVIQHSETDPVFHHVITLSEKEKLIPNDMHRYQWHACEHLYQHLTALTPLNSDGMSAYQSLTLIEQLMDKKSII